MLTGLDREAFVRAHGLGVERLVEQGSPSTVVVRAVTGAANRSDEESGTMRIVTGYLPTPEGEAALETALDEARLRDAELLVVHSQRGDEKDEDFVEAREDLEELEARIADQGVRAEVHHLVRDLPPGEDLVEFAREHGADLIVIGVRRRSPVGKLVLGSNAQTVVLRAACPVLCVKTGRE